MPQVTAKFIFRLPFFLKMQEVRGIRPKSMTREGEEIIIYPPVHTEKNMIEKRLWQLKTPKPNITQLDKLNCVVIDIRRDFPTIPTSEEDQEELLTKARKILHNILALCRHRRKIHIGMINIENLDYRLRLFDAGGKLIDATGMTHLTVPAPPFQSSDWDDICQDALSGIMPELHEIFLLDALSVVSQEPRRAVLDTSTAREIYVKRFYKSPSKRKAALNSLKKNKPELLEELDCLQKTNISVKHEGKCQYKDDKDKIVKVDSPRARKFISAVKEAIEYSRSLEAS